MKRVESTDGEVHYVVDESGFLQRNGNTKNFGESELKKTTKLEASKPLFLARAE